MQVYLIGAKKKNLSTKEPHAHMHNASAFQQRATLYIFTLISSNVTVASIRFVVIKLNIFVVTSLGFVRVVLVWPRRRIAVQIMDGKLHDRASLDFETFHPRFGLAS